MHGRPRGLLVILSLCIAVGIGALGLSVQNAVELQQQADARETDRVSGDLEACKRGNVLRQQIIDIGHANDEMISGILDLTFRTSQPATAERAAAIAAIRARLDAPIVKYRETVDAITVIDCEAAVPGARSTP